MRITSTGIAKIIVVLFVLTTCAPASADEDLPSAVRKWLVPQEWVRDLGEPTLELGKEGDFDDTHIFAPVVTFENSTIQLWYCGSTGSALDVAPTRTPDNRLFKLGLARSADGLRFNRSAANPVFEFTDPPRSILTPSILKLPDGTPIRENGKLRMWFTSCDFRGQTGGHRIHEASSADGVTWSEPSPEQLRNAYAPSVLKTGSTYQMWYTDVTSFPWKLRHAQSKDGSDWAITPDPVMVIDQSWEHRVLVYPCVLQVDGTFLMWYGSYTSEDRLKTAIGFAVSEDGIRWYKHSENPVVRPQADRPWESNYVTSESVIRLPDGRFRMWFASRKAPPFTNLYFAINTATWYGP